MKINKIAIAIGLVLILGIIILIGGIRITKANVLSATLLAQESQVLLLAQVVGDVDLSLQKNLVTRQLDLDRHKLLTLDARLANSVELNQLDDLRTLRNALGNLSLLNKA